MTTLGELADKLALLDQLESALRGLRVLPNPGLYNNAEWQEFLATRDRLLEEAKARIEKLRSEPV